MKHEIQSPHATNESESRRKRTLAGDLGDIRDRIRKNPEGLLVPLGLGMAAATAAAVMNQALDTQSNDPDRYTDILDTNISQLVIEDGATVRQDPFVGDVETNTDNRIGTLDIGEMTVLIVDSEDGVYVKENTTNGDWYGVPAANLVNVDGTESDEDGIVWVNEQKAYPANSPVDN